MSIHYEGREGEVAARIWIKEKYQPVLLLQADWIYRIGKEWFLVEAKHQEPFKPPPFLGTGLPLWQVRARLELQRELGLRALLFILDKNSKEIYWQFLDNLEAEEHYDTSGKKPRRVYPLSNFQKDPPLAQKHLLYNFNSKKK